MKNLRLFFVIVLLSMNSCCVSAQSYIYPTLPGSNLRDYSKPGVKVDTDYSGNTVAYPTLPGTGFKDYSKPGVKVDTDYSGDAVAYPTLPGTSVS